MTPSRGQIQIQAFQSNIHIHLDLDGEIFLGSMDMDVTHGQTPECLFHFIMVQLKPAFFNMPVKLEFNASQEFVKAHETVISRCLHIAKQTNTLIASLEDKKDALAEKGGAMFYNVDDSYRGKDICEALNGISDTPLVYEDMSTGFNPKTRQWEPCPVPMEIPDLIEFLESRDIGKIITFNHYLLEKYLNEQAIYIPALFAFLGADYVIIDNDPYDPSPMGYYSKALFHPPDSPRFSLSFFHRYWDAHLGLDRVRYHVYPQNYNGTAGEEPPRSGPEPEIMVLSQSRLENLCRSLVPVLFWMDQLAPEDLFRQAQLSYLALRRLILYEFELTDFNRSLQNAVVHNLFYSLMNLLKYEVIEHLAPKRRVILHGDQGWEHVFPELYRGLLDGDGVEEVLARENILYLLMNHTVSYWDASGPLYDALKRNLPFLNFPCIARPQRFDVLENLEYGDVQTLDQRLDNLPGIFDDPAMGQALSDLRGELALNTRILNLEIMEYDVDKADRNILSETDAANQALLEAQVSEFLAGNRDRIHTLYRVLILGEPVNYQVGESAYAQRNYIKTMNALASGQGGT